MPRMMIRSLMRPVMYSSPASSRKPRSPVRSQSLESSPAMRALNVAAVASSLPNSPGDVRTADPDLADLSAPAAAGVLRVDDGDPLAGKRACRSPRPICVSAASTARRSR